MDSSLYASIKKFLYFPIIMILRLYSAMVLLWDVSMLMLFTFWSVFESFFQFFFPPREKSIVGDIVLIVGASRGIGQELAWQSARLGAEVVCLDINTRANEETVKQCQKAKGGLAKAYAYTCDVSDQQQVLDVAERIKKEVGDVTIIIHCCGIPSARAIVSKNQDVRKTLDVSLISHFWILEAFLPGMLHQRRGHIVALSSVAGLSGLQSQNALCASQFAVKGLIETFADELKTFRDASEIYFTIAHIYPFILTADTANDIRLRIPSFFGTMDAPEAARQILSGMRRNYSEFSVPWYTLYLSNFARFEVPQLLGRCGINNTY